MSFETHPVNQPVSGYNEVESYPGTVHTAIFKTYTAHIMIHDVTDPHATPEREAEITITGSHDLVGSLIALFGDAFKDSMER